MDPMVLIPILHLEIYYGADIPTYCFSIYNGVDTILSYSVYIVSIVILTINLRINN